VDAARQAAHPRAAELARDRGVSAVARIGDGEPLARRRRLPRCDRGRVGARAERA
jgi:hypothetical protein